MKHMIKALFLSFAVVAAAQIASAQSPEQGDDRPFYYSNKASDAFYPASQFTNCDFNGVCNMSTDLGLFYVLVFSTDSSGLLSKDPNSHHYNQYSEVRVAISSSGTYTCNPEHFNFPRDRQGYCSFRYLSKADFGPYSSVEPVCLASPTAWCNGASHKSTNGFAWVGQVYIGPIEHVSYDSLGRISGVMNTSRYDYRKLYSVTTNFKCEKPANQEYTRNYTASAYACFFQPFWFIRSTPYSS